jgi:hypothetical protein
MNKISVAIVLLSLMLVGSACTKSQVAASPVLTAIASTGCKEEIQVELDAAQLATNVTGCTGTAAIQADITKLFANIGFCRLVTVAQEQAASNVKANGPVASLLCAPVLNGLTGLFTSALNPAYACPAQPVGDMAKLQAAIIALCTALPY